MGWKYDIVLLCFLYLSPLSLCFSPLLYVGVETVSVITNDGRNIIVSLDLHHI